MLKFNLCDIKSYKSKRKILIALAYKRITLKMLFLKKRQRSFSFSMMVGIQINMLCWSILVAKICNANEFVKFEYWLLQNSIRKSIFFTAVSICILYMVTYTVIRRRPCKEGISMINTRKIYFDNDDKCK